MLRQLTIGFSVIVVGISMLLSELSLASPPPSGGKIIVAAHRAAHEEAPENSLPAIRKAIELGCDYVELDVRTTRDGVLVLMHDSTVDRTTDGHGKVDAMTLSQIQGLDLGAKSHPQWKGERVPTFEEALKICQGKIGIYLDHKSADVGQTLKLVEQYKMLSQIAVYGSPDRLREYKKLRPEVWIMPNHPRTLEGIQKMAADLHPETMDGDLFHWTREQVVEAHRHQIRVWVDALGPMDNPAGYQTALDIGVDGIQTDHPEALLKFLKARGRR